MTDTDAILKERGAIYGDYAAQAQITHDLKLVMFKAVVAKGVKLAPDQEEAMEMFCVKLARIINGNPDYADNWRDIAGYATLVARRLEEK